MSAIICFEAVFPELTRKFAARGSQLIINLTNDGWYGDSAGPYQHLAMPGGERWKTAGTCCGRPTPAFRPIVDPSGRC